MPRGLSFHLRDHQGELGFLGRRLIAEGHEASLYCDRHEAAMVMQGLVPRAHTRQAPAHAVAIDATRPPQFAPSALDRVYERPEEHRYRITSEATRFLERQEAESEWCYVP